MISHRLQRRTEEKTMVFKGNRVEALWMVGLGLSQPSGVC